MYKAETKSSMPTPLMKRLQKAVGRCPYCKRYPTWFNNVPLKAYCWGLDNKQHREWHKLVPKPHNPYL